MAQRIRPDVEGQKFVHNGGQAPQYVVMDGILRWIPNQTIRSKIFGDFNPLVEDLTDFAGLNLNDPNNPPYPLPETTLLKGFKSDGIYLIDYNDIVKNNRSLVARRISDPNTMAQFGFRGDNVNGVDDIIVDALIYISGPDISFLYRYQDVFPG